MELDRFQEELKTEAQLREQNRDTEPRMIEIEDPWDLNNGNQYNEMLEAVRRRSCLLNPKPIK